MENYKINIIKDNDYINIIYYDCKINFSLEVYNTSMGDLLTKDPKEIFCFINKNYSDMITFDKVIRSFKVIVREDFYEILKKETKNELQ